MTENDDLNDIVDDDFEVLRAELIQHTAMQLSAIATVNVELPVHVAASIAAIRAEFSKDDFDEILTAALMATARTLNGVLPVLDRLGVPMTQQLEAAALGEEPLPWDGDLSKLEQALQPEPLSRAERRRKGRRR